MTINLSFYTTEGCHLCEEAIVVLQKLLTEQPEEYQIELIDIVQSDDLVARYGSRIPVIAKQGDRAGLGWPFDYPLLLSYVGAS